MAGGRAHEVLPPAKDLLAINGCYGKEDCFVCGCDSDRLSLFEWMAAHPCKYGQ